MLHRLILPDWAKQAPGYDKSKLPGVIEAELTDEEVQSYNQAGYNCYWLPNFPSQYDPSRPVDGIDCDVLAFVFVDLDMKDYQSPNKDRCHNFATKEEFVARLFSEERIEPTCIVDSGNGVHAYWSVSDLDPMSFLRLQRRLARFFTADPAVSKLFQLMRAPGTINWKNPDEPKLCEVIHRSEKEYTAEELDRALPKIRPDDEAYCKLHHDKTFGLHEQIDVSEELPAKWFRFAKKDSEPHRLFYGHNKDRSAADFRLAHLLYANDFTKEEAMAVLMNTQKAAGRAGIHRYNYGEGIVNKIWTAVEEPVENVKLLSQSVRDILAASPDDETLKGIRFPCNPFFDATEHGFRLSQVLGMIGGVGAGKTALGFNYFIGFAERNPNYIHLAVTLEQPVEEYAQRWKKICNGNKALHDCVHILGNYNDDGTYRHLSLQDIEDYIKVLEKATNKKVGCVMVDHIGVLKKETRNGENQGLIDICQYMKACAVNTNIFLIMQSQAPREKAGSGDIELDKDAAYGTVFFEAFCDYLVTTWQPLKRIYAKASHMTITCYKYCKIRHKNAVRDKIKEDSRYALKFDPETERMRELTEDEKKAFGHFNTQAINIRKRDKKTETGEISDVDWVPKKRIRVNGTDPAHS